MANKNLKSIKFPGLTDTYVVPQVDTTLTQTGRPADAKATGDAISALGDSVDEEIDALKEDLSTLNTEGTVPTSEQMLSDNYTTDSVPYHFRKTASDNADREELEIVGGSVAWNQLVKNPNFAVETNWYTYKSSIQYSNNTLLVTPTESGFVSVMGGIKEGEVNHKYLVIFDAKTTDVTYKMFCSLSGQSINTNVVFSNKPFAAANTWQTFSSIAIPTDASATTLRIAQYTEDANVTYSLRNVGLYDLTQMFGSTIADHIYSLEQATAGAGVALFKSLFPKDYYAYDSGSMQSVSGLSEHRTVGKNLLDSSLCTNRTASGLTSIHNADGSITLVGTANSGARFWKSTDDIGIVLPAGTYTLSSGIQLRANSGEKYVGTFTIDKQTVIENVVFYVNSGQTYNTTYYPQLEFGSAATAYEPYKSHSYPLDDSLTLRGVPTLVDDKIKWDGDVYTSDGKVKRRFGIVDLGTLTWSAQTDSVGQYFRALISGIKPAVSTATAANILCAKYPTYMSNNIIDKSVGLSANASTPYLFIRDTSYSDAATFKTAMSGVYLVYELSTPTTETADPYVSPQICSPYGTEEFVSTGIVPVGHNTKYPDNLRMKLDNLPWNFARLIAPVEDTFKATRNYDTGRRLIINNVLYIATANIANGANIVVGSNVRETNVDELLAELAQ